METFDTLPLAEAPHSLKNVERDYTAEDMTNILYGVNPDTHRVYLTVNEYLARVALVPPKIIEQYPEAIAATEAVIRELEQERTQLAAHKKIA